MTFEPFDFAFGVTGDATGEATRFARCKDALFRPCDESRMFSHFEFHLLPRLAVGVRGNGFVPPGISVQHSINEQSQLPVARVREIESAPHFDRFVVEREFNGRFGVTVDVPVEGHVLVLHAVLGIGFLA